MAWYDYVPIASNISGIAKGDLTQAATGPLGHVYNKTQPGPASQAPMDEERRRAIAMGEGFGADRAGATEGLDRSRVDPYSGRESAALSMLEQQAQQMRQGPSEAELSYRAAQGDISAQQMAYAGQAGGTAGVAARRDAMQNIAQQRQKAAINMAMMRGQEDEAFQRQRIGATTALASGLSRARGDEMQMAMQARQLHNQNRNALGNQMLESGQQTQDLASKKVAADEAERARIRARNNFLLKAGAKGLGFVAGGPAGGAAVGQATG